MASVLAVARVCPSGLNATEWTALVGPVARGPGRSHNRAVLLTLAVAKVCPSGLKATALR